MKSDKWKPWALLAPSMSAVLFLLVIPVCFVVVYSFWLRAPSGADIPAFQLGNYAKFFEDFFYPRILIRTIRIAFETVILCLVMGYIPAYFFYRSESRFKKVFLLLIMLPFWVSFIIRTMSWINIMGDSGLINHVLIRIGLIDTPFSMLYNEFTVLMGLIMYLLPFMVLNIYVSLEGIDKSLLEAARCLGCTEWQAFREVTLPLSLPGVSAGCLLVFILAIGYYITPALVGGAADQMISYFIAFYVSDSVNWGMASALGAVLLATTFILYGVYNRLVGGDAIKLG